MPRIVAPIFRSSLVAFFVASLNLYTGSSRNVPKPQNLSSPTWLVAPFSPNMSEVRVKIAEPSCKTLLIIGLKVCPELALKFSQVVTSCWLLVVASCTVSPISLSCSDAISPTALVTAPIVALSTVTPCSLSRSIEALIPRLSRMSGLLRPIPVTIELVR